YLPLASNVIHGKEWIQEQVSEYVEGNREMLVENLHIETDTFFRGKGVQVPAGGIDLARNVLSRTVLRTLKNHVFHKVRDPVRSRLFVAGPSFDPDTDRDRANALHLLRDHGEAVGQYQAMNVPRFVHHAKSSGLNRVTVLFLHKLAEAAWRSNPLTINYLLGL